MGYTDMLVGFMPGSAWCETNLMDKIVSWIKDNQLPTAAIVVLIAAKSKITHAGLQSVTPH